MDKNTYLNLWKSFETQREEGIIKDQYILDLESHYVMVITKNNGQRLGVRMSTTGFFDNIIPIEVLPISAGRRLEQVKVEDVLAEWQRINFPETNIFIFDDYSESEMFDSLQGTSSISVCKNLYKVVDLLGYGKESKVFKAVDVKTGKVVALKTGLVSLEKEVKYLGEIKRKLKGYKAADWFPDYLFFDKEKNIIVMEYIEGQTLEDNILQKLKAEENLEQLLLSYGDTVRKVCELKEEHNILYGQFNLRNILIDQSDSIRFLDPFYALSLEKYDTLQIIRAGAILMEVFYGLRDNKFPEKVKSAVNLEELKSVRISDPLWVKLRESCLYTKPLIDYKVKDVIKKCLKPESRLENLSEVRKEFEELKDLIHSYYPKLKQEKHADKSLAMSTIFKMYMEKRYKAVALDFNNTLSHTEETDRYLLEKISQLLENKIPIAIISGRRTVWINHFMMELYPFIQNKRSDILEYLHFYNSEGAIGYNLGAKKIYYEKLFDHKLMGKIKKGLKKKFPQINFDTHVRTDGYRLNFDLILDVNELNGLFIKHKMPVIAVTSGTSIDILPEEVNKGLALADFASRLSTSIDDIVKIADQGQKGGNDNSLLSGFGAFSVDNYEPNSNQVSIVETLGLRKVFATAWLLDNLKFYKGDFNES